jgi:hypothetical protein
MNKISTFTFEGKDIDVMYSKGNIAYTFECEGKQYGSKLELKSKSIIDIVSTTWLLLQNAQETVKALSNEKTN